MSGNKQYSEIINTKLKYYNKIIEKDSEIFVIVKDSGLINVEKLKEVDGIGSVEIVRNKIIINRKEKSMAEMSKIASDYNKVMKILSEYKRKEPIINKSKELMYELNVQGVSEKDRRLISHGYTYNQRRKTWFKIISPKTVDYEKKVLNFLGISSYQLKDANKIQMLDDEQEFMNYQKDLAERKQLIIEKTEKEYGQLKRYLQRLIKQGFEFNELKQQLEGRDLPLENDTPAFRFRYVTLAGTLFNKKDKIELGDRFDIYEYRENDSQCVLQNVTIDGVKEAVEQIR